LEVSDQLQVPAVLIPEKLDKRMNVSLSFPWHGRKRRISAESRRSISHSCTLYFSHWTKWAISSLLVRKWEGEL